VRFPGDVNAEHPRLPRVDRQQRREHLQHGGFSCPVGAEHAEDLPLAHVQVNAVDRAERAELLNQAGGVNSGCGGCHG
jgi:hypothetical protein